MFRTLVASVAILIATGCGRVPEGEAPPASPAVTVMTQNLYYGTEFGEAIAALLSGDEEGFVVAVTEAWGRVQATDFPARAVAIADEIEAAGPALVGLQEAALWRVQSPSDPDSPATTVAYDFVEILVEELARRGLDYGVASVSEGFDLEFPYLDESFALADVRLTDREVVLARADLSRENPASGRFATNLVLGGALELPRGWASVDATVGGVTFRFVSTHLEADDPGVREAQSAEIAAVVGASPIPVVLVGDFNYDLNAPDLDVLQFEDRLGGAGLRLAAPSAAPTCCADENLADPAAVMTQRLDLVVVTEALRTLSETVFGNEAADIHAGLWPSDHAAVAATIELR